MGASKSTILFKWAWLTHPQRRSYLNSPLSFPFSAPNVTGTHRVNIKVMITDSFFSPSPRSDDFVIHRPHFDHDYCKPLPTLGEQLSPVVTGLSSSSAQLTGIHRRTPSYAVGSSQLPQGCGAINNLFSFYCFIHTSKLRKHKLSHFFKSLSLWTLHGCHEVAGCLFPLLKLCFRGIINFQTHSVLPETLDFPVQDPRPCYPSSPHSLLCGRCLCPTPNLLSVGFPLWFS